MIKPTIFRLKTEFIDKIKKSLQCKNRLQFELGISYLTLQRWLNTNSHKLTTATALRIISIELDIAQEYLITEIE